MKTPSDKPAPEHPNTAKHRLTQQHRSLVYTLSKALMPLSYITLAGLVFTRIIHAFMLDIDLGIKCLFAAALPPLITTYFALFRHVFKHPAHVPKMPLYFGATIWMVILLYIIDVLGDRFQYSPVIGIFLLSLTFSELLFSRKYISFASSLSCSFGIITGLLIYFLIFGFSLF